MASLIVSLAALLWGMVGCQQNMTIRAKLPTNLQLIKGDVLRIPISDYVSVEGSMFTTNVSSPNLVEASIYFLKDIELKEPVIERCSQAASYGQNFVILVCNNKYVVKAQISKGLLDRESVISATLSSTLVLEQNQECSDMLIQNGVAYVSCYDISKKATDQTVVVYIVSIETLSVRSTSCKNKVAGLMRMVPISYDAANSKTEFVFFDYSAYTSVSGKTPFTRCQISTDTANNNTVSTAFDHDLSVLANISSLSLSIRAVSSLTPTEVLFVLADDSATKQVLFAVINVDASGDFQKSSFKVATWAPSFDAPMTNAKVLGAAVNVAADKTYIAMATLNMFYGITMTFDRTTNSSEFAMNTAFPAMHMLDCGLAADTSAYVGRITLVERKAGTESDFKQLIEYRTADSQKLRAFAFKSRDSNYACAGLQHEVYVVLLRCQPTSTSTPF